MELRYLITLAGARSQVTLRRSLGELADETWNHNGGGVGCRGSLSVP